MKYIISPTHWAPTDQIVENAREPALIMMKIDNVGMLGHLWSYCHVSCTRDYYVRCFNEEVPVSIFITWWEIFLQLVSWNMYSSWTWWQQLDETGICLFFWLWIERRRLTVRHFVHQLLSLRRFYGPVHQYRENQFCVGRTQSCLAHWDEHGSRGICLLIMLTFGTWVVIVRGLNL